VLPGRCLKDPLGVEGIDGRYARTVSWVIFSSWQIFPFRIIVQKCIVFLYSKIEMEWIVIFSTLKKWQMKYLSEILVNISIIVSLTSRQQCRLLGHFTNCLILFVMIFYDVATFFFNINTELYDCDCLCICIYRMFQK